MARSWEPLGGDWRRRKFVARPGSAPFSSLIMDNSMTMIESVVDRTEPSLSATPESNTEPKLKIKIKSWHTVASWKWQVNDELCVICRSHFDGCCEDCKAPGDDCPPCLYLQPPSFSPSAWGECNHAFHLHCILKWIGKPGSDGCCKSSHRMVLLTLTGPMCRQEWQFR